MNTFDPNAKYIVTPFADLKLYNQAYDLLKKMTKGNEFRILSIEPDELDNIKSVTVQEWGGPRIHTIRLSQREIDAFIRLAPKQLIDFDVASMYGTLIKPLKIKETTMATQTIEIGKTYKLVEPEIKTNALISGHKTLTDVFGEGEFTVEDFAKSNWFTKAYIVHGRRLDNNKIEKILVYEAEFVLFQEVEEQDPTDLLTRAVAIKTPFVSVCGWVTDQWIEDGVELLNVVHAGDFSVVPRSAVVNVLN